MSRQATISITIDEDWFRELMDRHTHNEAARIALDAFCALVDHPGANSRMKALSGYLAEHESAAEWIAMADFLRDEQAKERTA